MAGQDPNHAVRCQDRCMPAGINKEDENGNPQFPEGAGENCRHTVASMLVITNKVMYIPTIATTMLSLCHHHTQVVPNQVPVMVNIIVSEAKKAHGASPPVRSRPPKKNLFLD